MNGMSLSGLSLRDLEYLVAVAELRHFGRAARQCGVSQPALSAQVRKLEAFLGLEVFERASSGVLLTSRGGVVVAAARDLLDRARDLVDQARTGGGTLLSGPLRLGAIPTIGPYLLPPVLRRLREAFPDIQPILSEARSEELATALRADALDAALFCLPLTDPLLHAFPLFTEPLLLMHAAQAVLPPWPLRTAEARLLMMAEGHCLNDQALAACGRDVPIAGRPATGLEMLRHMVAAGEGLALVPALAAASLGTMDGLLCYTQPEELPGGPPASPARVVALVVRRSDPRTAAFSRLADLLARLTPPPAIPFPTVDFTDIAGSD